MASAGGTLSFSNARVWIIVMYKTYTTMGSGS
jgi:hypothetical protein